MPTFSSAPPPPPRSPPSAPPPTPTPITFDTFLPIARHGTSTHEYTIDLQDSFCIGTVPNGGYIASAFQRVAMEHMLTTHKRLTCPDPINLHVEYLRRTSAGPALFTVQDVKLGSRVSNLHITLSQPVNPSDPLPGPIPLSSTTTSSSGLEDSTEAIPMQTEVTAYVTCTSLAKETGPTHRTSYALLPPPSPVDLDRLRDDVDQNYIRRRDDPYGTFRRASRHMQMHLVRPERRRKDASPATLDQWIRFRPLMPPSSSQSSSSSPSTTSGSGSGTSTNMKTWPAHEGVWTNLSLGYIVDIFPQINERFLNADVEDMVLSPTSVVSDARLKELAHIQSNSPSSSSAEGGKGKITPRTFWYPTLNLNLDVKKALPAEGVEWLFVRVQAKVVRNGRFDLCVEVWDDQLKDLVAVSTHSALIMDMSRNTQRSGKGGKGGEGKRRSKI